MNSRRKFVLQGSLAAAAFLASAPIKILANFVPGSKSLLSNNNCLTLLHSAEPDAMLQQDFKNFVARANRAYAPLVLNASTNVVDNDQIHLHNKEISSRYSVINQNGILIGFISFSTHKEDELNEVNALATFLKNEKKCQLVVCISQLGFKHTSGLDDITLAGNSENIDIILGGNTTNFTTKTLVLRNKNKEEVIIQSSLSSNLPCGKLEIAFDEKGNKKHIHVATKFYQEVVESFA